MAEFAARGGLLALLFDRVMKRSGAMSEIGAR
jgi:hypothetical protein